MVDYGSGSSEGGSLLSCSLTTSGSTTEARCKPKGQRAAELDGCDWRSLKMARTDQATLPPFDSVFSDGDLPSYHPSPPSSSPKPYLWNAGLYYSGRHDVNGNGVLATVKGPFTPSQWLELEHQALVYKYIVANVPIPPQLLTGISRFSAGSFVGWGSFYSGCSGNVDPEPGRCRRTDGKKWRCSRDAVADQKYCERHMNRGRRRSRKHVEGQSDRAAKAMPVESPSQSSASPVSGSRPPSSNLRASQSQTKTAAKSAAGDPRPPPFDIAIRQSASFQLKLDAIQSQSNPLRHFIDDWSETQSDRSTFTWPEIEDVRSERTQFESEADQRRASWIPIFPEASMGGPLGEALKNTNNATKLHSKTCSSSAASIYLLPDCRDSIPPVESSPTGVLQKTSFGSLTSSTVSSPRTEACATISLGQPL